MKKLYAVFVLALLVLLVSNHQGWSQGFSSTALSWTLPTGNSSSASYNTLSAQSDSRTVGSQSWSVLDMNGDTRPDLVVLTEGNGTFNEPFGTGATDRYWKVYLNTGAGYATTATNWTLPTGGYIAAGTGHLFSFNALAYASTAYTGNQSWSVLDMNGDARPDLVVLTEGTGIYNDVFGMGTTRYWKVYLNTGTGFSTTATSWALPAGGYVNNGHEYSFNTLTNNDYSQRWSVRDLNGDARPDLVVLTENNSVLGTGTTDRSWKVYLNTGTSFAATATSWALPAGGHIFITGGVGGGRTVLLSFNYFDYQSTEYVGDQTWAVRDLNGDARPDLVILTEKTTTYVEPYGTGTTGRYWKVYVNTGNGFSTTAINWMLPAGGLVGYNDGHLYSFVALTGEGTPLARDQKWSVRDLNGDARPDLVIVGEGNGTYNEPYGTGTMGRYWKVYLNTGTGYATAATNWTLPVGGHLVASHNASFDALEYNYTTYSGTIGSQSWSVLDMNGDTKLDLVVYAERTTTYDNTAFGTGAARYWKVYLNASTVTAAASRSISSCSACASIYPNPTEEETTMQSPQTLVGQPYRVIDCLGRVLLAGKITAEKQPLDLGSLAHGVYIVQVGDHVKQNLRIVKQ